MAEKAPIMYFVYYLFHLGELVYIGRSHEPEVRKYRFEHRTGLQVEFGLFQRFNNFEAACAAEVKAIKDHTPRFNLVATSSSAFKGFNHAESAKALIADKLRLNPTVEVKRRAKRSAQNRKSTAKITTQQWANPETRARILAGQAERWARYRAKIGVEHG